MPFWFLEAKGMSEKKGKLPCHLQFGICILHVPEEGICSRCGAPMAEPVCDYCGVHLLSKPVIRYWNGEEMVDVNDPNRPEYPKVYANSAGLKRGMKSVGGRVPFGTLCYAWWQAAEDFGHAVRPVLKYLDMENPVPGSPRGLSRP